MCVARFVECAVRKTIALAVVVLLVTAGFAQNATPPSSQSSASPMMAMPQAPAPQHNAHLYSDRDYSKPQSPFPNVIAPYRSRRVPPPNLSNSARTDQLFRDGKIYLSINDAVAMALENNLDIVLQRYNLSIADTDLLRTKSGAFALGVNAKAWCRARLAAHRAGRDRQFLYRSERHRSGRHGNRCWRGWRWRCGLVGSTLVAGPPLTSYRPDPHRYNPRRARSHASGKHLLLRRRADRGAKHEYL